MLADERCNSAQMIHSDFVFAQVMSGSPRNIKLLHAHPLCMDKFPLVINGQQKNIFNCFDVEVVMDHSKSTHSCLLPTIFHY